MDIVMGIALAGAAGWNAFIPLLALGFAHRLSPRIPLGSPSTFIASTGGLFVLLMLLPVELFLDKSPGMDARNDRAAQFYRPIAGALIMLGTTTHTRLPPILAAIIGAAAAFGMHYLKTRYRRPLTRMMGGITTPVASAVEDFAVVLVCFAALLWPVIGLVLLMLIAAFAFWIGGVIQRKVARDDLEFASTVAAQP